MMKLDWRRWISSTILTDKIKKYETVGCCGLDCGLCPRFYTIGKSACPGCGGKDFSEKHPSCGYLTCCALKKGLEVCVLCSEFPCQRFDSEKLGNDSFVTHKKIFKNMGRIKDGSIEQFIDDQKIRIDILNHFLANYNDGRSRSFFCLSCALLPVAQLVETLGFASSLKDKDIEPKEKTTLVKAYLCKAAGLLNITLKLNNGRQKNEARTSV